MQKVNDSENQDETSSDGGYDSDGNNLIASRTTSCEDNTQMFTVNSDKLSPKIREVVDKLRVEARNSNSVTAKLNNVSESSKVQKHFNTVGFNRKNNRGNVKVSRSYRDVRKCFEGDYCQSSSSESSTGTGIFRAEPFSWSCDDLLSESKETPPNKFYSSLESNSTSETNCLKFVKVVKNDNPQLLSENIYHSIDSLEENSLHFDNFNHIVRLDSDETVAHPHDVKLHNRHSSETFISYLNEDEDFRPCTEYLLTNDRSSTDDDETDNYILPEQIASVPTKKPTARLYGTCEPFAEKLDQYINLETKRFRKPLPLPTSNDPINTNDAPLPTTLPSRLSKGAKEYSTPLPNFDEDSSTANVKVEAALRCSSPPQRSFLHSDKRLEAMNRLRDAPNTSTSSATTLLLGNSLGFHREAGTSDADGYDIIDDNVYSDVFCHGG